MKLDVNGGRSSVGTVTVDYMKGNSFCFSSSFDGFFGQETVALGRGANRPFNRVGLAGSRSIKCLGSGALGLSRDARHVKKLGRAGDATGLLVRVGQPSFPP